MLSHSSGTGVPFNPMRLTPHGIVVAPRITVLKTSERTLSVSLRRDWEGGSTWIPQQSAMLDSRGLLPMANKNDCTRGMRFN